MERPEFLNRMTIIIIAIDRAGSVSDRVSVKNIIKPSCMIQNTNRYLLLMITSLIMNHDRHMIVNHNEWYIFRLDAHI